MAIQYNSNFNETLPFSDVCAQINLVANVAKSYTVPGGFGDKYSMRLEYTSTSNIFVCLGAAPSIPGASTVTSQQYNEFRPSPQRYVKGGDVVYFITPDAAQYVGISLRQLPGS